MRKSTLVVALVIGVMAAMAASDAVAVFAGTEVFLPSVGRKPGAAGSQWYTTVWVFNPNPAAVNLTFYLLERDKDNSAASIYNDTLPAGDVRRYDNAIWTMFAQEVFGALRVVASDKVVVNSRIYSMAAGAEQKDSVGQFFAAVPASFAIGSGQRTQILGAFETSPTDTSEFRYNFGFVETAGANTTVTVTVYDETGSSIGSKAYSLRPYEQRQFRFPTEFPALSTINARIQAEITAGTGKAVVFGSGIANGSTDPSTFEMSFDDALLGASSGLTAVEHDATLTGNGTTLSPLGLANGAVSKAKLSAAGGSAGQVLGTNGSNLVWQTPVAFSLPFSGTTASAAGSDLFYVRNTGGGRAMHAVTASDTAFWAEATSGIGIDTRSTSNTGLYATSTSGMGVDGRSVSGTGVRGMSTGGTGNTYGVYGSSSSSSGYGVFGIQGGASGLVEGNRRGGVWGDSIDGQGVLGTSRNTVGVSGMSQTRHGVQGITMGGASSVGVYGYAQGDAPYAGYFSGNPTTKGNVRVTGTLTKTAGSFKIDHPLDPAGKYLSHSFVESPDMMNIYNGTLALDENGEAWVELPEWFESLNRDFRYQLTCIGGFAPVYIAEKVAGNRFKIAGGVEGLEVSWQVTGIRHDAYADAYRIPVEEVKTPSERGFFIHPELFGAPQDRSLDWVYSPELMKQLGVLQDNHTN